MQWRPSRYLNIKDCMAHFLLPLPPVPPITDPSSSGRTLVLSFWRTRSHRASLSCSPNQERWGEFVLPFRRRRVYATSPWFSPLRASVSPVVQFRVPVPVCFIWTTHRPLLRARRALILAQISCLHPSRRYLLPVAGKESPVLYPYPFSPSPEREFLSFFHH